MKHKKPEVIVEVYENGKLAGDNVQIPANVNDVEIISVKYDSVKLSWSPPKQGSKNVLHYNVVVYEQQKNSYLNRSQEFQKVFTVDTGTKTSANVFGLKASKLYAFSVETYCFLGKSAESLMTNSVKTKTCPIGMYHESEHNCEPCKPGEYSDTEGSHTCYRCYQGTYADKYNTSKCTQCTAGTYNSKMGQTKCMNCPAGTYSDFEGAFAMWFCKKCPIGTYNKENGKASSKDCLNCPIGSYSSNEGTARCSLCPFGSQTEQSGCKSPSCCKRNKEPLDKVVKSLVSLKSAVKVAVKKASTDEIGLQKGAKLVHSKFEKAKEGVGNQLEKGRKDAGHFFHTHLKA